MKRCILLVALIASACGGNGPTGPSTPPVTPPPPPAAVTLSGSLVSTNGGAPLSASMDFGIVATTAQNGQFSVSLPASAPTLTLTIAGAGLVSRRTYVAPGTRTVTFDAIAENGFDLTFYRQLVRNGFEGGNEPLRRWMRQPRIYLRTVDDAGAAVDGRLLDSTEQIIRESVTAWSGFTVAGVERGPDTRVGQSSWITVSWSPDQQGTRCGQATVGTEGGSIEFFYDRGFLCNILSGFQGRPIRGIDPVIVRHEVGHAMGFWHTDSANDIMYAVPASYDARPSGRELAHAAIAYRRPIGNTDPDNDSPGFVFLAPMRVP